MRKIYTITLEDDIPPSIVDLGKIKAIAYLLYCEISNIDKPILCANESTKDRLIKNELKEKIIGNKYKYSFISDKDNDNNYKYEPFMIKNNSFGFTVFDNSITDSEIAILLDNVFKLLGYKYNYQIDYTYYDENKKNDRYQIIHSIISKKEQLINNSIKTKIRIPLLNLIKNI